MFKYPFLFSKDKEEPESKDGETTPAYGIDSVK